MLLLLSLICSIAVLASCGQVEPFKENTGSTLSEVQKVTGYQFDKFDHSDTIEGTKRTVYLRSDESDYNTAALTISESGEEIFWAVNVWSETDLVTYFSTGEKKITKGARVLEADANNIQPQNRPPTNPKPHPDGCRVCTEFEITPGHYDESFVSEVVTTVVAASSYAVCASKGGAWAGGVCSVTATKLVKVLTWVPKDVKLQSISHHVKTLV